LSESVRASAEVVESYFYYMLKVLVRVVAAHDGVHTAYLARGSLRRGFKL